VQLRQPAGFQIQRSYSRKAGLNWIGPACFRFDYHDLMLQLHLTLKLIYGHNGAV
jgi:hypothetical protein